MKDDSPQRYMFLDEVGSTNEFALDLCRTSRPVSGTVIATKFQSNGRGQRGKSWLSQKDVNATFSVIYKTTIPPANQFVLVQMASLAVFETIISLAPHLELAIKWPNDIYIEDMKVAGILIQNIIKGAEIEYTVIGIGVNLNQASFDDDLPNPTSLLLETGLEYDRIEFIEAIADRLDQYMLDGPEENIRQAYHEALYLREEPSLFYCNDETIEGIIVGVDLTGKLKLDVDGEIRKFTFGELVYG